MLLSQSARGYCGGLGAPPDVAPPAAAPPPELGSGALKPPIMLKICGPAGSERRQRVPVAALLECRRGVPGTQAAV